MPAKITLPTSAAAHGFDLYPLLDVITRPTVSTEEAAFYLNVRPQTLRKWACYEDGPIRPARIGSRLAWRVADIRALLEGGAK